MAGVKGKSGGPRKNSGGLRPGAGRPRKAAPALPSVVPVDPAKEVPSDPLAYLISVMQDETIDQRLRVRAAVAAAQYTSVKKGDGGKKEEKADAAQRSSIGKFGPSHGPKPSGNPRLN